MQPIIQEIDFINPSIALQCFKDHQPCLLQSSDTEHVFAKYSFLAIDPAQRHSFDHTNHAKIKPLLKRLKQQLDIKMHPGLPPFQGGIIGALSYDFGHLLIHPHSQFDGILAMIDVIDQVIVFDHQRQLAWICCSGLIDLTPSEEKAISQIKHILKTLSAPKISLCDIPLFSKSAPENHFIRAVQKTRWHIEHGNIFQANITESFQSPFSGNPLDLYLTLQNKNPAPFSAYFEHPAVSILSTSPERFIQVFNDQNIQSCPIKGTISRSAHPEQDQKNKHSLIHSTKDQQENTMIVDLMRNDLAKVSEIGSVKVPKLNEIQSFKHVHHLVSTVSSTLKSEYDAIDALFACFPGGSITGAPKHESTQVIASLEHNPRGFYCGTLFYLTPDGSLDSNILIRSLILKSQMLYAQAGCGITYQSDPQSEWLECLTKLRSFT
ncbi:anthranilate synthase component I family protein [Gammaproteobacteria bacterium]|nr:anthranilate synthase component I family protein [Gammaproteobacteria bacterium]